MTLDHLKEEIAYLERMQKKVGLTDTGRIKLLWFRDAMNFIDKPDENSEIKDGKNQH